MKTAIRIDACVVAVAATALALAACDATHLLGTLDGGPPPEQDSGPPPGTDAGPDLSGADRSDAGPSGPITSWTGYIENYKFASGSDAVRVSYTTDATGNIVGTVTLGNGTPPPPATDPNVGYPSELSTFDELGIPRFYVAEGYAYTMRDVAFTGRRMQFDVAYWELWQGWCALQTPVPGQTSCLPNVGSMVSADHMHCALLNSATSQYDQPVDCGKLALCQFGMACMCGIAGCSVQEQGIQLFFDLSVTTDGASADGSVTGQINGHNVHLTKDP